jgi:hypothetical protein
VPCPAAVAACECSYAIPYTFGSEAILADKTAHSFDIWWNDLPFLPLLRHCCLYKVFKLITLLLDFAGVR